MDGWRELCIDLQYDTAAGRISKLFQPRLAPAPQAADDNWMCPGGGGKDQIVARGLLQHLIIALHYSPSCATSSRMATVTSDRAGRLQNQGGI